ncbi:hypothetical protein BM640_001245 [Shigella sonnei]|nr:hypothetical protein [Shigella sonnei]EFZ2872821.1 hypothetical protein [Shigella sonnei]EFZ3697885.1 hypothetical protein [Shigella sonnei]
MSDRHTPFRDGLLNPVPMAGSTTVYGGHMVGANAGGYAVPASAISTQVTLGVSNQFVDNRLGANGDQIVLVSRGKAFCLANHSADPVTQADIGKKCFVVDSVTVAKTNDTDKRPVAGTVMGVDSDGVWVLF